MHLKILKSKNILKCNHSIPHIHPSLQAKVPHHFVILVFQHMTMKYKTLSLDFKALEWRAIIFGKFYSQHSHISRVRVDSISEYLFNLFGKFIVSGPKLLRIQTNWSMEEPMYIWSAPIDIKILLSILINIKLELFDFLRVDKMKMYGMCVWG